MFYRQNGNNKKKIKHYAYSQDDRIGKGYSSVVYRGTNELTNETIAIKAIDMKGVKDAVSREMLDCEIQALTKLKHPNILKCHDVVRETSHCYIITELCNQGDLSSHLKKKRRLTQPQTLRFMKDIVSGFIEIAEKNFLHRDLKLANIFLSNGKAIIADFGFAKKHSNVFQKEKYNVGSPLYMSPEALKKNIYSVKNDIWSIGIMIYELLHGQTPWECKTQRQLMDKMVKIQVKFRDSLVISDDTKMFIKKCLQVNEDSRMSLRDLKEWNSNNAYESLSQGKMNFSKGTIPVLMQVNSCKEGNESNALVEVTNRVSSRSQSNANYHTKSTKQMASRQNSSFSNIQKENKGTIPKAIIEKNNNTLILEINTFRLLFKIYEKIKKYLVDERQLASLIGNEVIKRVTNIMSIVCPDKENPLGYKGEEIGLLDIKLYLNEETNPSIKKYKTVVQQYFRKYNSEIKIQAMGRQSDLKQMIRNFLRNGRVIGDKSSVDQMTMFYWMIQLVSVDKWMKKEYLDGVIEPKSEQLRSSHLRSRIQCL